MRAAENGNGPAGTEPLAETGTKPSRDTDTVAPGGDVRQPKSPYLTVEDVGRRYHASARTIREWARLHQVPHLRRSNSRRLLFLPSELEAFDAGAELETVSLPGGGRRVRIVS
jgi:hypothetical protein